jgi:hypothetical protein
MAHWSKKSNPSRFLDTVVKKGTVVLLFLIAVSVVRKARYIHFI